MKKLACWALCVVMVLSLLPMSVLASNYDASVSGNYFTVISENMYPLAPGATETELVLNNSAGNDRKVVHYFEVDTKNENIEVLPGYYGIDKLDPDNLALDGVADKSKFWKAEQLTKTVAYYENLGYNVVGAMNTALAYDSDAPYGYMVWNGVVLGTPDVHKGAKTYLAIDAQGNCELRDSTTPLNGTEVTAISANFTWLVKNGQLVNKTVERTSSDASRSMIGIRPDGSLIFCQVDGRNAPFSSGLSEYEMGEMMLSIGCVNAINCDGGGSSTFVSKREGETSNTMRSIPSDGSERATINSVIIVSKAQATGEFDHAVLSSNYNYYAPGTTVTVNAQGVDASGSPAEIPADGITWALSDSNFGAIANGVFVSNGTKGDVTVQMFYNGEIVGQLPVHVVDPDVFSLSTHSTVLPYGKSMNIDFACTYGVDDWEVCVDGAYTLTLSDPSAAILNGNTLIAPTDESIAGVDVTATYISNPSVTDTLNVTYGKGSEIIYDFEDENIDDWYGYDTVSDWLTENGVEESKQLSGLISGGQISYSCDSHTFLSNAENGGKYYNGENALGVTFDFRYVEFNSWVYAIFYNVHDRIVLRDVANGKNATAFGFWVYVPEGFCNPTGDTTGALSMQLTCYVGASSTSYKGTQMHMMFYSEKQKKKVNLSQCSEADIPENRWIYVSADLTGYNYVSLQDPTGSSYREPAFIRMYIKPTRAQTLTYYFDDFTLDYSSAVDDREAPIISNPTYCTNDTNIALNGQTINTNVVSFNANVQDYEKSNAKGLDYSSAKIYIDGMETDGTKASGSYMSVDNVSLTNGKHNITFVIADKIGNSATLTKSIVVDCASANSAIKLSGHNDLGNVPEYDSVYYADLVAEQIEDIESVQATLKLQSANRWELDHMIPAPGFTATYTVNPAEPNYATVTVTRTGDNQLTGEQILVSIPIRVWSWDESTDVGGDGSQKTHYTKQQKFNSKLLPRVDINVKTISSTIEYSDGKSGTFSGEITVATKLVVNNNPWHDHDAVLTNLSLEATCEEVGYADRTYCETCGSVIDWGTTIPATGHKYDLNGQCEICGEQMTLTGLYQSGDNWYYYINGVAASGWQMIDTDWYYFDPETKIGADGVVTINEVNFTFEDGRLTSGVWVKTLYGNRYYYGPGYYNDRGSWRNIDGKDYYFFNGVALNNGYQMLFENQINLNWYYFNADGTCDKTQVVPDGFYTDRNGYAYASGGKGLSGLYEIGGKYYYFNYMGYAQKNGTYSGRLFMDDYAAFTGILENNNTLYYYVNGLTATPGLYEFDGAYYNVTWGGVVRVGEYFADTTNCDLPVGKYVSGADGKLLNGIYDVQGEMCIYKNGRPAQAGLYEFDGAYYLAKWNGAVAANGRYYASASFCDLPANANYTFDADGRMLNGVVDVDNTKVLYCNGTTATYGLYKVGDDYYFSGWGGVLKTGGRYYVGTSFCDLPANANYTFDADGKMLNGIVNIGGTYYLYQNGTTATYGLYKIGDDYYFSNWGGVIRTNGRYYVDTTFCDLPANANYTFDAEGKMLNGVVNIGGTYYLYKNGTTVTYGLYKVGDEYYFANWGGVLKTDGRYYVDTTFCDLPANANYTFDAEGKMLNGVVNIGGTYYLYKNGTTVTYGLYKVGDDYYFANWGGLLKTDGRYFVDTSFCDLPVDSNYTFDATGKMLNGFVTVNNEIYYYVNGNTPAPQIICVDGDYYYVNWGGKIATGKCFVPADGVYSEISLNYTFNELGQLIR